MHPSAIEALLGAGVGVSMGMGITRGLGALERGLRAGMNAAPLGSLLLAFHEPIDQPCSSHALAGVLARMPVADPHAHSCVSGL